MKIIHSNSFDINLAISLLNYFPEEMAMNWIDNLSFKTESFRVLNLTRLACSYFQWKNLSNKFNEYEQLFNVAFWNNKYGNNSISFNCNNPLIFLLIYSIFDRI